MIVVILAAGIGSRMKDLTKETPKPLLISEGKTLLEHKFQALPSNTSHIILVIGYLGEQIVQKFGKIWNGIPISYVIQEERLGTAHALWCAKDLIQSISKESFMVLMADDIYNPKDLEEMSKKDFAILVQNLDTPTAGGKCHIDEKDNNKLVDIVEDPQGLNAGLLYTGACVLPTKIFDYPMVEAKGLKKEYGLPQTLVTLAHKEPIDLVHSTTWKNVTRPEDLK